MFYAFDLRKTKKVASFTLVIVAIVLVCRFVILPHYLFPRKYSQWIEKYAEKYALEPALVYAVVKVESDFDTNAVSRKNARGLMQISQITGEWGATEINLSNYTFDRLFEPEINVEIGCWYLNRLIKQYDDEDTAFAAYNAGSGNVSKWLKDPIYSDDGIHLKEIPYPETENYVKKINIVKTIYEKLY